MAANTLSTACCRRARKQIHSAGIQTLTVIQFQFMNKSLFSNREGGLSGSAGDLQRSHLSRSIRH